MLKRVINSFLIAGFVVVTLFWSSCEPDDVKLEDYTFQRTAVKNYTYAESVYNSIFRMVIEVNNSERLHELGTDTIYGAVVTRISPNNYKMVFGLNDTAILSPDNRTRLGRCDIAFEGDLMEPFSRAFVTFDGYFSEGKAIDGSLELYNAGSEDENPNLFLKLTGGIIDYQYDYYYEIKYNMDESLVWVEGSQTPDNYSDDRFLITGFCYGRTVEDDRFDITIERELVWDTRANYYYSGRVGVVLQDFALRDGYVDFAGHYGATPSSNSDYWYAFRAFYPNSILDYGDSAVFRIGY